MHRAVVVKGILAGPPPGIRGLIAGLIKGNQWVFINPDHKAGYFFGGGTLDSLDVAFLRDKP